MQRPSMALVLAFLVPSPAPAAPPVHADFGSGMEAYLAKDYPTARAIFLDLAELGDGPSQYNLGAMMLRGEGAPRDRGTALGWLRAAKENGYDVDPATLEQLQAQGSDSELAAADQLLGRYGAKALQAAVLPVPRGAGGAPAGTLEEPRLVSGPEVRYPSKALERGVRAFVVARYVIGVDGVPRDPSVLLSDPPLEKDGALFAEEVLRVVAQRRYLPAKCNGRLIEVDFTVRATFGFQGDKREVKTWLVDRVRDKAKAGHPYYQYVLGLLAQGNPPIDVGRAEGWRMIVAAAQAGVPEAQYYVGHFLAGSVRESVKAVPWLRRAAAAGLPDAQAAYALVLLQQSAPPDQVQPLLGAGATTKDPALRRRLLASLACSSARANPAVSALTRSIRLHPTSDPRTAEAIAAGRAAGGDFSGALAAQRHARDQAKRLGFDVTTIEARLADYEAGRPCTGELTGGNRDDRATASAAEPCTRPP